MQKAIAYYTNAVQTDTNYAGRAIPELADAYALAGDWKYSVLQPEQAFAQASAAAARALAIDDSLGEAHASLAFALDLYAWDWKSADVEFRRAIQLNPSYATAHQWYSWHLIMMGRTGEALTELHKAESLDPLSLIISADIADALCVAGQDDEAVRQSMKTLELDPNFAVGHFELGQALQQQRTVPRGNRGISKGHRAVRPQRRLRIQFGVCLRNVRAPGGRAEHRRDTHGEAREGSNGRRRHRGDLCRAWVTMTKP